MRMMNKTYAFVAFSAMAVVSCSGGDERPADAPAQLKIETVVATSRPFEIVLETTGDILPFEEVALRAPIGGNVLEVAFEEGTIVKEGDLIIKLDDRSWQAQANGVRARIKNAKNDLKRKKALLEIDGASQEEVDMAQANLSELQAQLQELEVNIGLANVRAPFSGVLGFRNFSLGSYLSQGDPITTLTQTNKLKLDFDIPAKYASKIQIGKEVTLVSNNDTAKAVIYAIEPSLNNATRTLGVRAKLDEVASQTPGGFAQVFTALSIDSGAISLPTDAIVPELNAQNVFVVKNGFAKKTQVTLGSRDANAVQILKGISDGDTVITSGLLMVKDGMRVATKQSQID